MPHCYIDTVVLLQDPTSPSKTINCRDGIRCMLEYNSRYVLHRWSAIIIIRHEIELTDQQCYLYEFLQNAEHSCTYTILWLGHSRAVNVNGHGGEVTQDPSSAPFQHMSTSACRQFILWAGSKLGNRQLWKKAKKANVHFSEMWPSMFFQTSASLSNFQKHNAHFVAISAVMSPVEFSKWLMSVVANYPFQGPEKSKTVTAWMCHHEDQTTVSWCSNAAGNYKGHHALQCEWLRDKPCWSSHVRLVR